MYADIRKQPDKHQNYTSVTISSRATIRCLFIMCLSFKVYIHHQHRVQRGLSLVKSYSPRKVINRVLYLHLFLCITVSWDALSTRKLRHYRCRCRYYYDDFLYQPSWTLSMKTAYWRIDFPWRHRRQAIFIPNNKGQRSWSVFYLIQISHMCTCVSQGWWPYVWCQWYMSMLRTGT